MAKKQAQAQTPASSTSVTWDAMHMVNVPGMRDVVLEAQKGTSGGATFYSMRAGRIKNVPKRVQRPGVIPPEYTVEEIPQFFPFVPFRVTEVDGVVQVHPTPAEMAAAYAELHELVTLTAAAEHASRTSRHGVNGR